MKHILFYSSEEWKWIRKETNEGKLFIHSLHPSAVSLLLLFPSSVSFSSLSHSSPPLPAFPCLPGQTYCAAVVPFSAAFQWGKDGWLASHPADGCGENLSILSHPLQIPFPTCPRHCILNTKRNVALRHFEKSIQGTKDVGAHGSLLPGKKRLPLS